MNGVPHFMLVDDQWRSDRAAAFPIVSCRKNL